MDQPQYSFLESHKREEIAKALTEAEILRRVADNIDYLEAPLVEKIRILVQALPDVGHQLGLIRRWYEKGILDEKSYQYLCNELLKLRLNSLMKNEFLNYS